MVQETVVGLLTFTLLFMSPNYSANVNSTKPQIAQNRVHVSKIDIKPKKICYSKSSTYVPILPTNLGVSFEPALTSPASPSSSIAINPVPQPTTAPSSLTSDQIAYLGNCESGMTPNRNSGNGYYGAFQFAPGTWSNMGTGYSRADEAPINVQIDAVQRLVSRSNVYSQFPACSQMMHSAGIL